MAMATARTPRDMPRAKGLYPARLPLREALRIGVRVIAIVAVAALLFAIVLKISVAGIFRDRSPAIALAFAPFDAEARAVHAERELRAARTRADLDRARILAVEALRRDPTNAGALRTLGLIWERSGNLPAARRLLAQSQTLSRRDRLAHVWLIGDYERRGDIGGMVRQFDIALRTSVRSRALLFPALVSATADPRVVAPLARTLEGRPDWWLDYMEELAEAGPDPRTTTALSLRLLDPAVPEQRRVVERLLGRLADAGEYDLAWRVYSRAKAGRPDMRALVRNGGFESADGDAPFDWAMTSEADLAALREGRRDGRGNALSLIAYNGRSGEVARQLLRLAPGNYQLRFEAGGVPADLLDRPRVAIVCAREMGRELVTVRPAVPTSQAAVAGARFVIPRECSWQWITIFLSGSGPAPETNPWIDNISITATRS